MNKMKTHNLLGGQELLALTLIAANTTIFSEVPRHFFEIGANAAWLAATMGGLTTIGAWFVIGLALERYPGQGLFQLAATSLGKFGGTTYNILLFCYFTLNAAIVNRLLAEATIIAALPNISISLAFIISITFVAFAAYRGLNALAKSCYIALPFIAAGVLSLLFLSSGNWNFKLLQPWLGFGFSKTVLGGILTSGLVGDTIVLALLADVTQLGVSRLRCSMLAISITAILQIGLMLVISMVFPYPVGGELTLPYYMLSRSIALGMFVQRLEALFLVSWALAIILKVAIVFMCGLYLFKKTFGIVDGTPLVIPYAGLIFALGFLPSNYMSTALFNWWIIRIYGGIVTLVLPVIIALISIAKSHQPSAKKVESA
jgi:spore germination protein (amino acid permease)